MDAESQYQTFSLPTFYNRTLLNSYISVKLELHVRTAAVYGIGLLIG